MKSKYNIENLKGADSYFQWPGRKACNHAPPSINQRSGISDCKEHVYNSRCAAHVDVHYPNKNTDHVTTAVAARKHGCINNSWINSNSECAHTHAKHVSFCPQKESFAEKIQQAFPHALNKLNALEALPGRKHKATSGPAFIIERKAPSDLKRLKRMVPPQIRTETEVRPDILPPRNTLAENAFADPCPRARPIPIVPDHMQVREELVRWHTFALPRVCSRAHVPHIHAQPSKMRGTGLIATIATRIPTIHTCRCVEARTIAHVP